MFRIALRSVIYLASIGLALHLLLPQLPGIERSLVLVAESSRLLLAGALLAYLGSQLCYSEVLGRSAAAAVGVGLSRERRKRRGLSRWYMFRLTIAEHGAARVLPGGGSAAAAVTYTALRARGLKPARVAVAVATISVLIYGTLAAIFLASLLYLVLDRELNPLATAASLLALLLTAGFLVLGWFSYRRPVRARRLLTGLFYQIGRLFMRRRWSRRRTELRAARTVIFLQTEVRALRDQLLYHPLATLRLAALALGYWGLDAVCLLVVFLAFGVPFGIVELLVAYGVASTLAALPLTPGGAGVFETTALAVLALLGFGPEAAIPVLGYRLFNFWLPIPLAIVLYPTLLMRSSGHEKKPSPSS